MTDAHHYLADSLQRVIAGGDITSEELHGAIPDPRPLTRQQYDAWEELSHWADDADIREKDPKYAVFKRDWMRAALKALMA